MPKGLKELTFALGLVVLVLGSTGICYAQCDSGERRGRGEFIKKEVCKKKKCE